MKKRFYTVDLTYPVIGMLRIKIEASSRHEAGMIASQMRRIVTAKPTVDAVSEKEVVGWCEDCSRPIFIDEKSNNDQDGITWHEKCPKIKQRKW